MPFVAGEDETMVEEIITTALSGVVALKVLDAGAEIMYKKNKKYKLEKVKPIKPFKKIPY